MQAQQTQEHDNLIDGVDYNQTPPDSKWAELPPYDAEASAIVSAQEEALTGEAAELERYKRSAAAHDAARNGDQAGGIYTPTAPEASSTGTAVMTAVDRQEALQPQSDRRRFPLRRLVAGAALALTVTTGIGVATSGGETDGAPSQSEPAITEVEPSDPTTEPSIVTELPATTQPAETPEPIAPAHEDKLEQKPMTITYLPAKVHETPQETVTETVEDDDNTATASSTATKPPVIHGGSQSTTGAESNNSNDDSVTQGGDSGTESGDQQSGGSAGGEAGGSSNSNDSSEATDAGSEQQVVQQGTAGDSETKQN